MAKKGNNNFVNQLRIAVNNEELEEQRLNRKYDNWVQLRKEQGKSTDKKVFDTFCDMNKKQIKNIWKEYFKFVHTLPLNSEDKTSDVDLIHSAQEKVMKDMGRIDENIVELKRIKDIITLGHKTIREDDTRWETIQQKWEELRKEKSRDCNKQLFEQLKQQIIFFEDYEQFLSVSDNIKITPLQKETQTR